MKLPKRIKVVEKRLGREKAAGIVYPDDHDTLHIDPTLCAADRLEILLHEGQHLLMPSAPEMKIRAWSRRLAAMLLSDGWRRIHK